MRGWGKTNGERKKTERGSEKGEERERKREGRRGNEEEGIGKILGDNISQDEFLSSPIPSTLLYFPPFLPPVLYLLHFL